jgi:TusA-related sulfurtransferase
MKLNQKIVELTDGDILKVTATDPGFAVDAQAWCKKQGHTFIKTDREDKNFVIYVQKGSLKQATTGGNHLNGSTMVVFSGDL